MQLIQFYTCDQIKDISVGGTDGNFYLDLVLKEDAVPNKEGNGLQVFRNKRAYLPLTPDRASYEKYVQELHLKNTLITSNPITLNQLVKKTWELR